MAEKTPAEIDTERFAEFSGTDDKFILAAYEATFTYHHMIVQARFATAGLLFTSGTIFSAAILSESVSRPYALILGLTGVIFSFLVLLFDARNRHLLDNCVNRGLRYERKMKISETNGFFGLMKGPQDEPSSQKFVSHSTVMYGIYCLFILLFLVLPWLKK